MYNENLHLATRMGLQRSTGLRIASIAATAQGMNEKWALSRYTSSLLAVTPQTTENECFSFSLEASTQAGRNTRSHTRTHTNAYTHTHAHTHWNANIHTHTHTHTHITKTQTHTYAHTQGHTHTDTHILPPTASAVQGNLAGEWGVKSCSRTN